MKNKKDIIRVIALATVILMLLVIPLMMIGCGNQAVFDTTWTFERAVIFLPDGEKIEGDIQSWKDFDSSDMIQVTVDGKTYLTHSSNVILISE
jgi:uncharacterized lipoprotein NlpE involved in copper resistance